MWLVGRPIGRRRVRVLDAGGEECSAIVKSTVLRAVKAGRISGTKDERGEWHVEPSELRVYPPRPSKGSRPRSGAVPRSPLSTFGIACARTTQIMSGATITVVVARLRIPGRHTYAP